MPIIEVKLIEGRDPSVKQQLIRDLTDTTAKCLGAPVASIRVILQEVPAAFWGIGGTSKAELDAASQDNQEN